MSCRLPGSTHEYVLPDTAGMSNKQPCNLHLSMVSQASVDREEHICTNYPPEFYPERRWLSAQVMGSVVVRPYLMKHFQALLIFESYHFHANFRDFNQILLGMTVLHRLKNDNHFFSDILLV